MLVCLGMGTATAPVDDAVVGVWAGGVRVGSLRTADVDARGLLLVDLGDEWAPFFLSGVDDDKADGDLRRQEPAPYRSTFVALANERVHEAGVGRRAARDRFFELWGIPPSLSTMQRRLDDRARHACNDEVNDDDEHALAAVALPLSASQLARPSTRARAITRLQHRAAGGRATEGERARLAFLVDVDGAARAVLAHLVCEGLLSAADATGGFGPRAVAALGTFQRREAIVVVEGVLDEETRVRLVMPSRRRDWQALLRTVRERVADAAGLVEDGTAADDGEHVVVGQRLDARGPRAVIGPPALPGGAPDAVADAADVVVRALGLHDEATAADALRALPRGPVAVASVPRPSWHGPAMELDVTIDKGDVDRDGLWRPAMQRQPTFVLTATVDDGGTPRRIPLVRWPTTVGGWQPERQDTGAVVDARKPSPFGDVVWAHVWAQPAWYAPKTTPDDDLLIRAGGHVAVNDEAIGPGYRSAYGLVMFPHERARTSAGDDFVDTAVRTHGTGNVRSVLRGGPSHGCHRLLPVQAQRLATFLLRHRAHRRDGPVHQTWERRFDDVNSVDDAQIVARRRLRGVRWTLSTPIPVRVLSRGATP